MSDLAVLGLSIDSSQAKGATVSLDAMTAAAAAATEAMLALAAAANKGGEGGGKLKPALEGGTESLRQQRMALRGLAGDLALVAPQFGTLTTVATALYIENAHLIEGFGGLKSALGALITPQNLMIGGIVAIVAGGAIAARVIGDEAIAMANLAERTNTTSGALHGLAAAAAFKGINTADFTKAMEKFSELTETAKYNTGALAEQFRVSGIATGTLEQNVSGLAGLMAKITDSAQKYNILTALGLPATREFVAFLSQGKDGIAAATAEAQKFDSVAEQALVQRVREFDEGWNRAWRNFADAGKNAFMQVMTAGDHFANQVRENIIKIHGTTGIFNDIAAAGGGTKLNANSNVSNLYGGMLPQTPAGLQDTKTSTQSKALLEQSQPRIGVIGKLEPAKKAVEPAPQNKEAGRDRDHNRAAA